MRPTKATGPPWSRWGSCVALRRALTLYRWANSISKGVSRERGGGFTVTEMTLEFSTVVFLGQSQQVSGEAGGRGRKGQASPPSPSPECLPLAHAPPPCHVPSRPAGPPTSAGPGSCPGFCRARCPPRTQTSHQPLEGGTAVTLSRLPQPGPHSSVGKRSPREEAQAPWSCPPPSHTQHCGWRAGVAVWVP